MTGQTVRSVLDLAFPSRKPKAPEGASTIVRPYPQFPDQDRKSDDDAAYRLPPLIPFDVFAIAALLMELSGAYHHVIAMMPSKEASTAPIRQLRVRGDVAAEARAVASAWRTLDPAVLRTSDATRRKAYAQWVRKSGIEPLFEWWATLFGKYGEQAVFAHFSSRAEPPPWWSFALKLLIAADEASSGIGFAVPLFDSDGRHGPAVNGWLPKLLSDWYGYQVNVAPEMKEKAIKRGSLPPVRINGFRTLTAMSPDVGAVLPKTRTPATGCTLRSLSHNLALLPPRGIARGVWSPYTFASAPPDEDHLNILLVPFPYTVTSSAFKGVCKDADCAVPWGLFEVEQVWLHPFRESTTRLVAFVEKLIREAERQADRIHAVVFPELALDDRCFSALEVALPRIFPSLELLIAGVSQKANGRKGNFVRMSLFQRDAGGAGREHWRNEREKHHRWKLDSSQIKSYALEGRLSPAVGWWEDIDLMSRRVDFAVFRTRSVITSMICEDLARIDPCQGIVRSIGPSLVVALLMDAPQLKARWPARYATVLAEDPGSAVLTLTSRGLMTRQNRYGGYQSKGDGDRVIALWRDDLRSEPQEISCGLGHQAVRLTVFGQKVTDVTLDGRADSTAVAWRYAHHVPIRIENVQVEYADVLGDDEA